jgi:hypothetical protein
MYVLLRVPCLPDHGALEVPYRVSFPVVGPNNPPEFERVRAILLPQMRAIAAFFVEAMENNSHLVTVHSESPFRQVICKRTREIDDAINALEALMHERCDETSEDRKSKCIYGIRYF